MKNTTETILVVAAHPDDEILGCGGSIHKFIQHQNTVHILILSQGITSRDQYKQEDIQHLQQQCRQANTILGVPMNNITILNHPDNQFDTRPLLTIVKDIETIKQQTQPTLVFTHHPYDLNIDHQRAYQATITAFRPTIDNTVHSIYSYEVLSSTEYNPLQPFTPNTYYDITSNINTKLQAMKHYTTELQNYPHPRSLYHILQHAQHHGTTIGKPYAEAFQLIRGVYG